MLSFVLAESALELVPREIRRHPAVAADARRRERDPEGMLLDRSFHHAAMDRLKSSEKRGRPDLVHAALLSVTGTPLYLDGGVRLFVHTCAGRVVEIAEKTRIPKNYIRFRGLMEEALSGRSKGGLVKAREAGMRELVGGLGRDGVFGLSILGSQSDPADLAVRVVGRREPAVVVGGFAHGHFSKETTAVLDELVRVHSRPLEAHVVAARVLYEVERTLNEVQGLKTA